jgi:hypothetical protein
MTHPTFMNIRHAEARFLVRVAAVTALAAAVVVNTGCATYQQRHEAAMAAFQAGNAAPLVAMLSTSGDGDKDAQLKRVELARVRMLNGEFSQSRSTLGTAINKAIEKEDGPVISIKTSAGTALASTVADDRVIPYNLPGYEAVMALLYQSLNHVFLGDRDAAGVELRRAVYLQDGLSEAYEKDVEEAQSQLRDEKYQKSMGNIQEKYVTLGPVMGRIKSGIQNPYVWYMSGLLYEVQRDPNNAYICYKKAWEIVPQNASVQRDVLRLARTQNSEEYEDFKTRFGATGDAPADGAAEVVLIVEEGLISQRVSEKIPIFLPIPGTPTLQSVTFPVYRDGPYIPAGFEAAWSGHKLGTLAPVCYLQSLAYHDLDRRMPGVIVRNVTRAATRAIAIGATQKSDNNYVKLAGLMANVAVVVADQADTRAWYSLPMAVQLLRVPVAPGDGTLRVWDSATGEGVDIPMHVDDNEKKLVWIADIGRRAAACSVSLTRQDVSASFTNHIGRLPAPRGTFEAVTAGASAPSFVTASVAPTTEPAPSQGPPPQSSLAAQPGQPKDANLVPIQAEPGRSDDVGMGRPAAVAPPMEAGGGGGVVGRAPGQTGLTDHRPVVIF